MLFYQQIKREFTHASWRRGQTYFREDRVKDVMKDGDLIVGKVQGTNEAAYNTGISVARGGITNSSCSCPAHRQYEQHCKHVAALAIWVLERGSLLRLGVGSRDLGLAEKSPYVMIADPDSARNDIRLRMLLNMNPFLTSSRFQIRRDQKAGSLEGQDNTKRSFSVPVTLVEIVALREHTEPEEEFRTTTPTLAEPVAYVCGLFQSKALNAISIEPALRYNDPDTDEVKVDTVSYLTKTGEASVYRAPDGTLLRAAPLPVPVLGTIEAAKVFYQGPAALENLAALLTSPERQYIVIHQSIDIEVDTELLKLGSVKIGGKLNNNRSLSFEFLNSHAMFTSEELEELQKQGRVSGQYVWKDDKLYKFETSLQRIAQLANRSGVAASEAGSDGEEGGLLSHSRMQLRDDEQYPLHPLATFRLSLELGATKFDVDEDWKEFHEWRGRFDLKKTPALPKTDYGFDLREYQKNGLTWLWSLYHRGLAALLADDMGLGKTHQVLAMLSSLYRTKKAKPKLPSLVVAPTSVVAAWEQKLIKYETGLKYIIFHGKGRKIPATGVDLVLTTYGILQREASLRERDWHIVALDEAQAIKNAETLNARSCRALKAQFRIAMTGTPVENQSTDAWSLLEFLLPGYLGSLPRFKRLYGAGRDGSSPAQAAALKRLISPFLLRRTKAQVLKELPEKTEEVRLCQPTEEQKKAYRGYLRSAEAMRARKELGSSGGKVDYANILALLTRLKQVCDHPHLPGLTTGKIKSIKELKPEDAGKWEAFEEILEEALGSSLKVVVFTQYLGMIDLVAEHLKSKDIGFTELRGDTTDRAARLKIFAEDPNCKVFICSLLAGSLGIDLTSASVCVHLDRWWNPARENQATDRLHRIGQTRGVQVFKLQIPGTVEDRIAGIIESKVALADALIEESSVGLKTFSRKELLELLTPLE